MTYVTALLLTGNVALSTLPDEAPYDGMLLPCPPESGSKPRSVGARHQPADGSGRLSTPIFLCLALHRLRIAFLNAESRSKNKGVV
jgi:hypothetical protein